MGESLYTVLGVDRDADAQSIDRAYRALAKSRHPDNNDDPDARRQFKRLTVARDTLVDDDERAAYDQLGHEAYVRQRGLEGLFDVESSPSGAVSSDQPSADIRADGYGSATDSDWWANREQEPSHGTSATPTGDSSADSIYGGQTVHSNSTGPATHGPIASLVAVLQKLGVWAGLHLILLASVAITGWFLLAGSAAGAVGMPVTLLFVVIAIAAVAASAVHIALTLYT